MEMYRKAIEVRLNRGEEHGEAWVNLAAMHHKYGKVEDAIWHYERAKRAVMGEQWGVEDIRGDDRKRELGVMIFNNWGQALSQVGRVKEAVEMFRFVLEIVDGIDDRDEVLTTKVHVWRACKMACDWSKFDLFGDLKEEVVKVRLDEERRTEGMQRRPYTA